MPAAVFVIAAFWARSGSYPGSNRLSDINSKTFAAGVQLQAARAAEVLFFFTEMAGKRWGCTRSAGMITVQRSIVCGGREYE